MKPEDKSLAAPRRVGLRDGRELVLRLLERSDFEGMAEFYATMPREDGVFYSPPEERTRDGAAKRAEAADSAREVCLVLVDEAGKIHGETYYRWKETRAERSVFGIAVRRTMQGLGAGRVMMQRLLEIADNYGPPLMSLSVQEENARARNLYKSMGFMVVKTRIRPERTDAPPMPEHYMERTRGAKGDA